jgi:hypothetical protein
MVGVTVSYVVDGLAAVRSLVFGCGVETPVYPRFKP